MSKKKCLDCENLYEPSRSDSKFCSTTCKARFHKKKKNKEILNGITPVIKSDNPEKENKQVVKTINTDELKPCDNLIGGLKSNKVKENGEEEENEAPLPDEYVTHVITMVNPAYQSCSEELYKCRKSLGILDECLQSVDRLIEYFYNEYAKNLWPPTGKADEHKEQWDKAKRLKEKCLSIIPLAKEREKELLEELKLHPAEFQTEQQELNSAYTEAIKQKEEKLQKETAENTTEQEEDNQASPLELNEEKMICKTKQKTALKQTRLFQWRK